jgi:hypothetical protein
MTTMTNPIERSIELHHSGVVHAFLKKNRDYLRQNPEMRAKAVNAFFQSHGGQSMYNGKIELIQTDLYRLLDLVKKGVLQFSDFADLVPKTEYRIMMIMNSRIHGWASDTEIAAAVARPSFEWEIKNLLERTQLGNSCLTDFEKDAKKALEESPGLRKMLENQVLVGEVIHS